MNKNPTDIEQILPYGEMLRGFMEQPFISKSDLKCLLRQRGVFTCGSEKKDTIPVLMSTLLSPDEFDFLRECQNTKEDNPKIITQSIGWDSQEYLINTIPERFDLNSVLDLEFSNFSVIGSPSFVPVGNDPDHIIMNFEIERKDMAKNWATNESVFTGSLELEKVKIENQLRLAITHTATETKYVATKAAQSIVSHFKAKGYVKEKARLERIIFSHFTNANRIEYFWTLTKDNQSQILKFIDIVDLEFSPDSKQKLPEGIKWMEERIDNLKMNGKALHDTFFIKEKQYHPYLLLYRVDARFKFDLSGLLGECTLSIDFPEYSKAKDATSEMEVNVKSIAFKATVLGSNKNEIKQRLLKEMESQKLVHYQAFADVNENLLQEAEHDAV